MSLFLGISLLQYLQENVLSLNQKIDLAIKIVRMLDEQFHKKGWAHLDIDPKNVALPH